ncbi:MAG: hypothetical protein HYX54_10670 [Chloroflexi bacterium]|nr:hypothetical protein [Chloroflexota bacterium]
MDPRTPTPGSGAALDHLEWCRRCSDELQELALAIVAMRRFGEAGAGESESASSWPSLRARILDTRAAAAAVVWRWQASLAGLAAGTLLVAAMVGPLALHVPLAGGVDEPTGSTAAQLEGQAWRIEANYLRQSMTGSLVGVSAPITTTEYAGPRRYPDNTTPERKEVPVRTIDRALQPD